jgi:hypothetical protein
VTDPTQTTPIDSRYLEERERLLQMEAGGRAGVQMTRLGTQTTAICRVGA